jgi:hypothetical protein
METAGPGAGGLTSEKGYLEFVCPIIMPRMSIFCSSRQ